MNVQYDLVVDFVRPSKTNTVMISEGDNNSRLLHFVLLENKVAFDMSDVVTATVRGVKQDGSIVMGTAEIVEDESGNKLNQLDYLVPDTMADTPGKVTMTITLNSNMGESITSFEFYIIVRNALYNEDDYISATDMTSFRDILNRALAAIAVIENMTSQNALPNPYALNINLEDELIAYNGSSEVEVNLSQIAYIDETESTPEDPADETSAAVAVEAANDALSYKADAEQAKADAEQAAEDADASASSANTSEQNALGYAGQAAASATLARGNAQITSVTDTDSTVKQIIEDQFASQTAMYVKTYHITSSYGKNIVTMYKIDEFNGYADVLAYDGTSPSFHYANNNGTWEEVIQLIR